MDAAILFPWYGPLIWPAAAVVGFTIQMIARGRSLGRIARLRAFLMWWFALVVGLTALVAFSSIVLFPSQIAERIGYRTSGFEYEVAAANLAFAVLGFWCVRYRQLWEATTIGVTVFLWGAAVGHLYHFVVLGNVEPYNVGPILYTDIFGQLILIMALVLYRRWAAPDESRASPDLRRHR